MTPQIRLLESRVVDQIAAGEVIERPASVVKELVENALDAGATRVVVALEDGGRGRIRVEDNGHGMTEPDALMAIERHATSKIRTVEDLVGVRSLGFRGEALPSIAAVSRFTLTTRVHEAGIGTRVRIDAGTLTDVRPSGAAAGTVIEVRDLFHTLPARRAFLRSAPTEQAHAVDAVRRLALVRPDAGFEVRAGERTLLTTGPSADLAERGKVLSGYDELVPIEVDGFRGWWVPGEHRATVGEGVHLYVDGRWVRDRVLRNAIHGVFRDRVPAGRSPLLLLDLSTEHGAVDVNVHPTKSEVRFRDPAGMATRLAEALAGLVGRARPRLGTPVDRTSSLPFALEPPQPIPALPPEAVPQRIAAAPAPSPALAAEPVTAGGRVVGMVRGRFALIERAGELVVYDAGRAALRRRTASPAPGPRLLVPVRATLPPKDVVVIEAAAEALERFGLRVAILSPTEVVVRALPEGLGDAPAVELLTLAVAAMRAGEDPRRRWGNQLPATTPITVADVDATALAEDLIVGRVPLP